MQMPSIRTPFYLANNNAVPVQQHEPDDENIYVPPEVEYYCRGPNFDPEAACNPPAKASAKRVTNSPASPRTIVVQRGDTLYSIARRHRIPVEYLADENGLETHQINAGQQLELPQYAKR